MSAKNPYQTNNPYASANPYAQDDRNGVQEQPGTALVPQTRLMQVVRPAPEIVPAMPTPYDGWVRRRQIEKYAKMLPVATEIKNREAALIRAADDAEDARETFDLKRAKHAAGFWHEVDSHVLSLEEQVVRAKTNLAAAAAAHKQQQIGAARREEIDRMQYEAQRLQLTIEERQLKAELSQAGEIGMRKADLEYAKVEAEVQRYTAAACENETAVETHRARRGKARRKRQEVEFEEPVEGVPEDLRPHLERSRRQGAVKRFAKQRIAEIQAAARGRELSVEEVEEIDSLRNGVEAAGQDISLSVVSDFEEGNHVRE